VKKDRVYIAALIAIGYISHRVWFDPNAVLFFGDWKYSPLTLSKQLFFIWGSWLPGPDLGVPNIQTNFLPSKLVSSLAAIVTGSAELGVMLTVLIPIAILGFLAPYFLFRKLTGSPFIGFSVALFYGSTSYFILRQTNHLFIAELYAVSPFVFYLFMRTLEKNTARYWIAFALAFSLALTIEARISLLLFILLAIYFLVNHTHELRKYWKNIIMCGLLGIGLNAFWLAPMLFGGLMNDAAMMANRGLFGNWLFDLPHSLALFDSAWTGGALGKPFVSQPVLWFAWFVPVLAWLALLVGKREDRKKILFFAGIALVGIFLTKQSAEPLPGIYSWLYKNVPGFNLFREASKYFFFTAIGYAGLIACMLAGLKDGKPARARTWLFGGAAGLLIVLSLLNLWPVITGEIGTLWQSRRSPNDYKILQDFIEKQPDYFRVLWVPRSSWWATTSAAHQAAGLAYMNQSVWRDEIGAFRAYAYGKPENVLSSLSLRDSDKLLDEASIKYVVIPAHFDDADIDIFEPFGGARLPYKKKLDNLPYLKRLDIGTDQVIVYENSDYKPHMSARGLSFYSVNPSLYRAGIERLRGSRTITFKEATHSGWSLYLTPLGRLKQAPTIKTFGKDQTKELKPQYAFGLGEALFLAGRNESIRRSSSRADRASNSWTIDAASIKKNYPAGYFKTNSDGSVDIEVAVFFRPQRDFYLGLILSLVTLAGCLVYFIVSFLGRQETSGGEER
jgi:hypothetical protein